MKRIGQAPAPPASSGSTTWSTGARRGSCVVPARRGRRSTCVNAWPRSTRCKPQCRWRPAGGDCPPAAPASRRHRAVAGTTAEAVCASRGWRAADVVSMLVRFDAGASVPDHHHAIEEDSLVIDGEMFLGDLLLRQGDFQLAPAGGGHWGETSDVGCLFTSTARSIRS